MIDLESLAAEVGADALEQLARDVSPREYFRGQKGGREFVLMLYPDVSDRNIHEMQEFIRIGAWLAAQGLKAPALYEAHEDKGYALFEDLGGVSFGRAVQEGVNGFDQDRLYLLACDVLKVLKNAKAPQGLPLYRDSRIHENRRQLVDYYMPLKRGKLCSPEVLAGYLAAWQEIEDSLPPCPQGFVHGDFHLENMMLCSREKGAKACGLIDYQDALYGPQPYDLVNLLEDARVDVPPSLQDAVLSRYCEGMGVEEKKTFLSWYRVLGTQFHCRVLGLFIKLAAEQSRDKYLIHINRLQNYIQKEIQEPVLAPLKAWFQKESVDFLPVKDLNGREIRQAFRDLKY